MIKGKWIKLRTKMTGRRDGKGELKSPFFFFFSFFLQKKKEDENAEIILINKTKEDDEKWNEAK